MKNTTPFNLSNERKFEGDENSNSDSTKHQETKMPSEQAVENILNYSKALSIRKSNEIGFIENVLN